MSYFIQDNVEKFIVIDNERYCVKYINGTKCWYKNGNWHREDGPAIEYADGDYQEWWLNGKRHREDGPAYIDGDYYQEWYLNGKLHREDGPAVINGDKQVWYLNGIEYSKEEYYKKLKELK